MKKTNKKGFAMVKVFLIVIVLMLVGFIGYQAYQSKNKDSSQSKESGSITKTENTDKQQLSKEPSIKIISTASKSPNGNYTITVEQLGDGYDHTLVDKSGKAILNKHSFGLDKLPGYNKDWFCQCGGPEFKGWSSDDYFVVELRSQSQEGQKLLRYHMAVDASNGQEMPNTFKLISEE